MRRWGKMAADPATAHPTVIGSIAGATSATLPTHQTGDLIICLASAYSTSSAPTVPTLPGGWTDISLSGITVGSSSGSADATTYYQAHRFGYRTASSSATATGTWTNAQSCLFVVIRGFSTSKPFGLYGEHIHARPVPAAYFPKPDGIDYPSITYDVTSGTSLILGLASIANTTTNVQNAPANMTNIYNAIVGSIEVASHYGDQIVQNTWPASTVNLYPEADRLSIVLEILAA